MLKLFEVEGFKNFKNKFILDFSDIRDYKFNGKCISKNLLGKMIIYGKNSIGKSNFGLALFDIVSHLTNKNVSPGLYDYYLNADKSCTYAEFHYVFTFEKNIIDYRYRKDKKHSLIYEYISVNEEVIFEYDYIMKKFKENKINDIAPTLNWEFKDVDSILKYVLNNTVLEKKNPLRNMMNYISNMLWFRNLDKNRYIGYKNKSDDYYDFIFHSETLNEFEEFLHKSGVEEDLIVVKDNDGQELVPQFTSNYG
jgi:AAA15 family ATPase/GTPase